MATDLYDARMRSPPSSITDSPAAAARTRERHARELRDRSLLQRTADWFSEQRYAFSLTFGRMLLTSTERFILDIFVIIIFLILGYGIFMLFNFAFYFGSHIQNSVTDYFDDLQ